jgi:Transposase DDE domain group 1
VRNSTGLRRRRSKRNAAKVSHRSWSAGLRVTGNGTGVVAHAGCVTVRLLADRVGLTEALSAAMGGAKNGRGHDRGRVLVDVAVGMADGLDTIRRMGLLSVQEELFGQMASRSTLARVLTGEVDAARLSAIGAARAEVRETVWQLIEARHGRIPAATMPGGDLGEQIVVRVDANFVDAYSRKEGAAQRTGRFGLHPMNVYCDNTGESLVSRLRTGLTSATDAGDHISVLTEAIFTQLPPTHRHNLLVTIDGAGATHRVVEWLHGLHQPQRRVEYSIGWKLDKYHGPVIYALPEQAWVPMLTKDGTPGTPAELGAESGPDTVGEVAEITDRLPFLTVWGWPRGLRVFVRRVKPLRDVAPTPLPGVAAQLELDGVTDAAARAVTGWRYDLFATNSLHRDIAWLDARHRAHARVEDRIRCGKHVGAAKYPFQGYAANTAWLTVHGIAADLLSWTQLLACDTALAKTEPQTLQDRVLHAPASIRRGGRRRWLNFPPNWPWTGHIVTIFQRIQALPAPP